MVLEELSSSSKIFVKANEMNVVLECYLTRKRRELSLEDYLKALLNSFRFFSIELREKSILVYVLIDVSTLSKCLSWNCTTYVI